MVIDKKNNFSRMILISVGFHIVFFLFLMISFTSKMTVVPSTMTVELSSFNMGSFKGLAELKERKKGNEEKKQNDQFFSDSKSSDSVKEEKTHESFLPPKPTHEEIKREHQAQLEKMLQESGDENAPVKDRSKQSDEGLLSEDDLKKATEINPGKDGKNGQSSGRPQANGNADIDSGLELSNKGRGLVYMPEKPVYPEWARRESIQGIVKLKLNFDKDGFVIGADIVQSSGNNRLDILAKNYALQIRIQASLEESQDSGILIFNFKL
jgi:TonB family protein